MVNNFCESPSPLITSPLDSFWTTLAHLQSAQSQSLLPYRQITIAMRWTWLLTIFSSVGCLAAEWIIPGVAWYDTEGKKIDAHGGAVVRRGDVFYWVGYSASSKSRSMPPAVP